MHGNYNILHMCTWLHVFLSKLKQFDMCMMYVILNTVFFNIIVIENNNFVWCPEFKIVCNNKPSNIDILTCYLCCVLM